MNKYASQSRVFRARNVVEGGALAPPADFTMTSAMIKTQLLQPDRTLNLNGNFNVQQVGVFCNFADGLVFKDARYRLDVLITARTFVQAGADLTGVLTFDPSTKNVTAPAGTGAFLAELVAGDYISIIAPGFKEYAIVNTITNNDLLALRDYPFLSPPGLLYTARKLTASGGTASAFLIRDISELNYFHACDAFLSPNAFSVAAATDILMTATIQQRVNGGGAISIPFLTKGIDVAFTNDVFFDIVANVEYTKR